MKKLTVPVVALIIAALVICPAAAWESGDIVGTVPELSSGPNEPGGANVRGTQLGNTVADAVRDSASADIAIINGGDLYQNLLPGQADWDSVIGIFSENRRLAACFVTPAGLRDILEAGLSHIVTGEDDAIDKVASAFDGFPQVSGITVKCDGSAPAGKRVMSLTLSDGAALALDDNTTLLKLAASEYMLSGGYGMPEQEYTALDLTLADALAQAIADGTLSIESGKDRVVVVGTADDKLVNGYLLGIVVISAAVIGIFRYKGSSYYDYSRNNTEKTRQFDNERAK